MRRWTMSCSELNSVDSVQVDRNYFFGSCFFNSEKPNHALSLCCGLQFHYARSLSGCIQCAIRCRVLRSFLRSMKNTAEWQASELGGAQAARVQSTIEILLLLLDPVRDRPVT